MILLSTRTCWGLFAFSWFADMQETLPPLLNMLPTSSQTDSTFEIFPSLQRTEPVPDVGGVKITNPTHHELILAMQTLYAGAVNAARARPASSAPQLRRLHHHRTGTRRERDSDEPACSTPAHLLYRNCPLGDGTFFRGTKAAPHTASGSRHHTIPFLSQSTNQPTNQPLHVNLECEKRTNTNT